MPILIAVRAAFTSVVALCVVACCAGCGGPPRGEAGHRKQTPISGPEVAAAFAQAGVPLHHFGHLGSMDQYFDEATLRHPAAGATSPPLAVEVFASVRLAQLQLAAGGTVEDNNGNMIRPLARVANVVVTLDRDAAPPLRAKVIRALARLRRQSSG